jgi:glycosyltransferase involved in cell wall biosynthesis
MRTSVLVPLENCKPKLPALLKALAAVTKKSPELEILFVDNNSTDGSRELLESSRPPRARLLTESRTGTAEDLNCGLREAKGELILLLDPGAQPAPNWALEMERALEENDLVVGEILSLPPKKPTPHGQLAAHLFSGHSKRTAHAQGHALPWGPAGNLGFRRELLDKAGIFSVEAAGAFDIDWCWRALLKGARLAFAEKAVVRLVRENERLALLRRFEQFGLGEAWLHRTYAFLLSPEDREPDALTSAVEAFTRLRHYSQAAKSKAFAPALEEVATAFACGVRIGYERPHRNCPLARENPVQAISWRSGDKTVSVFVPGKGLAQLEGKPLKLWEALRENLEEEDVVRLCMRLFKLQHKAAVREVHEFRKSLSP